MNAGVDSADYPTIETAYDELFYHGLRFRCGRMRQCPLRKHCIPHLRFSGSDRTAKLQAQSLGLTLSTSADERETSGEQVDDRRRVFGEHPGALKAADDVDGGNAHVADDSTAVHKIHDGYGLSCRGVLRSAVGAGPHPLDCAKRMNIR